MTPNVKEKSKYGKQGIIVRISSTGLVLSAENWDGSEIDYESDAKKLPGALLAYFEVPSKKAKAVGFMKKAKDKWKKKELYAGLEENKNASTDLTHEQGIIAHIGPDGKILKVANLDGSKIKHSGTMNLTNTRLYVHNGCCWKKVSGRWKCRSSFCPK